MTYKIKKRSPGKTLAVLNDQATHLRVEMETLRQRLAESSRSLHGRQAEHLAEANEQLVRAARQAEEIVATAVDNLDELSRTGQHDALTDIPNRVLMRHRLDGALSGARKRRARLAVLFVDLDNFKHVNDTLGHAAGDHVVQHVARRISAVLRGSDIVGRHGGDEFLVLLADVADAPAVASVAQKILDALATPLRTRLATVQISASIGIAIFPEDGCDAATLVARADAAMYTSKRCGPSGYRFWCADDDSFHRDAPCPHGRPHMGTPVAEADSGRTDKGRIALEKSGPHSMNACGLSAHADRALDQKYHFLASVANELRNPRSPIRTAAAILVGAQDAAQSPTQQGAVIEHQVAEMVRRIEWLLDDCQVGSDKRRFEQSTVNMDAILREVAEKCHPMLARRRQRLHVALPPCPLSVIGDADRLSQIFWDLIQNASAFTQDGGDLTLAATHQNDKITISVSDNGFGITAEALPFVFEPFMQNTYEQALRSRGLGIGLALVRELVEAHAGSIVARSAGIGFGSEFIVQLPLAT